MNEEQLLKDIENDPLKFGEVYEAFHNKIFGYVYRRTMDYEAASDITAETFLKAYLNISKFKWNNISLLYWLYKIATNELNKYFNSHKYKPLSLGRIKEEYGIDITDHSNAETENIKLQDDLEKHQEFLRINQSIRLLDLKYQEVISLKFFEHKSIKEIAIILAKKEGTVKSLLSRGIAKLKEKVKR
ncbi:MAG: sigma-70 family polymerase sigma factor [Sediminibacterium sp.]|nr:sigma-70 family polymerase sigma factor [Sediminibacterium sp.]